MTRLFTALTIGATALLAVAPAFGAAQAGASAQPRPTGHRRPPAAEATQPSSALDLQVLLDRAHFSPGEIDGVSGSNTDKAVAAFKRARGLADTASNDDVLQALGADSAKTLMTYTITAEDAAGPFTERIPTDIEEQAKLRALHYTSIIEALGEQFHASPNLLRRLNPGARFAAGEQIQVPNVEATPATSAAAGAAGAAKIVVSKSNGSMTAFDAAGKILLFAPVTSGSEHDPLPIGEWKVTAVVRNPTFNYNPDLFWDADPSHAKAKIPPGPNGPVGVVWIDITKEHYGIHGSPEPRLIGKTSSHGCVRLTNWDAQALARLVQKGTPVIFEE